MVKFHIYYEPFSTFNDRLKGKENYVYFDEVLLEDEKNITIDIVKKVFKEKDTCVFGVGTYSRFSSLVFENVETLSKLFEHAGVKLVMLHNPPKVFYKHIQQKIAGNNLKVMHSYFEKITEEQINKINVDLNNNIIGQEGAKKRILIKLVSQLVRPSSKPLVLMLYGDPGVGKTETAKQLSTSLYGNDLIVREQMSMVGGESSVKYFKATSHSEDSFSKSLLNRQSNVILFDEFALVPSFFHSAFFQMFDEGVYEDQNYRVDISNSIIICTSNFQTVSEIEKNIDVALLSRFDAFIKYEKFTDSEKHQILKKIISEFLSADNIVEEYKGKLDEKDIFRKSLPSLKQLPNYRAIRKFVEDIIADILLDSIILK